MQTSRWRFFLCLLLASLLLVGSAPALLQQTTPSEKLLAAADELIPVVARLRSLKPKAPIQKGVKTREEISQFVKQEVGDHYQLSELKSEGILLQKLGLIPPGLDYVEFTLKLLTEQIGGYYDSEKKAFFIAGWLPLDEQKPAMVHELTHALQDQYFDLEGIVKRDRKAQNDDTALAHQAIAEGDATAVMLDYLLEPVGKTFVQLPDLVFVMQAQLAYANNQYEILKSAPDFIKQTLVFPYSYGAAFLQKARAHGEAWSVVDKIYSNLPASTEQIIHPEKYLDQRDDPKPVEFEDPTPRLGKGWRIAYKNVLGEFSLYLLLKLSMPEEAAKKAASGWGGDQIILAEDADAKQNAVFAVTVWDNQESADRFYEALSMWLQHGHAESRKLESSENALAIVSGGEYRSIRRQGTEVRFTVGLPESYAEKLGKY